MSIDQIAWKTAAWKNPEMVAGYAKNIADTSGGNLLKNRVETELFQRFVCAKDVLDVGIGTGRASLPLARAGYRVTGVDSSEAMLRKCRELAGGASIELIEGDVAQLPFRDEMFDTVMALNTIAHFPHWSQILKEWSRVLRPGGRMIFDMFSMDHDVAYATAAGRPASWGVEHFAPSSVQSYYLRLPVNELVDSLASGGLKIEAAVPYSVFCGTKGFNRFFEGTALSGFGWDRLLSWVAADSRLFDFITFLEQELVAHLTSVVGCRYMAVIKKVPDEGANAEWIARNAAYNRELSNGLSLKTVTEFSDLKAETFKVNLHAYMDHAPNRFALARILFASLGWPYRIALDEFLEEPYRTEMQRVLELGRLDADVTAMLQTVHRAPQTSDAFTYKSVPMGPSIEYHSMIAILDRAFGTFDHQVLAEGNA